MAQDIVADAVPDEEPLDLAIVAVKIDNELHAEDLTSLKFLCQELVIGSKLQQADSAVELIHLLESASIVTSSDFFVLADLLQYIGRVDILEAVGFTEKGVLQRRRREGSVIKPLYVLLLKISDDLTEKDVKKMASLCPQVPQSKKLSCGTDLFTVMCQHRTISHGNVQPLVKILQTLERTALVDRVTRYVESDKDPRDVKVVPVDKHTDSEMYEIFLQMFSKTPDQDVYPMVNDIHGIFLLITNASFKKAREARGGGRFPEDRTGSGSNLDVICLKKLFEQLHFEVVIKEDCTAADMKKKIRKQCRRDFKKYDCFACAILSHGTEKGIMGVDVLDNKGFGGEKAGEGAKGPVLKDGGDDDDDMQLKLLESIPGVPKDEPGPAGSPEGGHVFLFLSTVPGYRSYRDETGSSSWFIQAVVSEFSRHAHSMELTDLARQ
ncbi:hypothetical protein BaRGS_00023896, partial [Batillaria attramentaria]